MAAFKNGKADINRGNIGVEYTILEEVGFVN
jgi:hypothetical protein